MGCLSQNCQGVPSPTRHLPHHEAAAIVLCRICREQLATCLRELPTLYLACELVLGGVRIPHEKVSSSNSQQSMPFNTAAADARFSIKGILASWASLIADERNIAAPPRQVVRLAPFLHENIFWLSAHSAAGDAVEEIVAVTRLARQAAEPGHVRIVPVGDCVRSDCNGKLRAVVKKVPGARQQLAEIRCGTHKAHRWAPDEWLALGNDMGSYSSVRKSWFSVMEIEVLWKVSTGSIYRLANQYRWRRHKTSGKVYYHSADVVAALNDGRQGPQPAGVGR